MSKNNEKVVTIIGDGKYPQVELAGITVAERPAEGDESSQIFFNPRDIESFRPEEMASMKKSIRTMGLLEPPLVRIKSKNAQGLPTCVELIAGERRLRSIMQIVAEDAPCWDEDLVQPEKFEPGEIVVCRNEFGTVISHDGDTVMVEFELENGPVQQSCKYVDVMPTTAGSKLYQYVPCKVVECNDERALRYAFDENEHSEPLTTREEINLVNRLTRMGHSQTRIAEILGNNVTWVSQTTNFKDELPPAAYEKLINNEMTRHCAVKLLSFAKDKRQQIFDESVKQEAESTAARIAELKAEQFSHQDAQELLLIEAADADKNGDTDKASKARRKAAAAAAKANVAIERKKRVQKESGTIKQGHIKDASASSGISPKKAKMLDREQIEEFYIKVCNKCLAEDVRDPITGDVIPSEHAGIVRRTLMAILNGQTNWVEVHREFMFDNGFWEREEEEELAKSK